MPTFDEQRQAALDDIGRELGPHEGLLDGLSTDGAYLFLVVSDSNLFQEDILALTGGHLSRLKRVRVPHNVYGVNFEAFEGCSNLEEAFIANTVHTLYAKAFYGCTRLHTVNFYMFDRAHRPTGDWLRYGRYGLRLILPSCFEGCTLLRTFRNLPWEDYMGLAHPYQVGLPLTVELIGKSAFKGTALRAIKIPADVRELPGSVFEDCRSLNFVFFASNSALCEIHRRAFFNSGLKRIKIPRNVKKIFSRAFFQCRQLSVVSFAKDAVLESIGHNAFNRTAVRRIRIPRLVTHVGRSAFESSLNVVYFEGRNRTYEDVRTMCGVSHVRVRLPDGGVVRMVNDDLRNSRPFGVDVRLVLCDTKEPFQVAQGARYAELHDWVFPLVAPENYGVIMPSFRRLGLQMKDMRLLNDSDVSMVELMARSEAPFTDRVAEIAHAVLSPVPFNNVLDHRSGSVWFDM